MDICRCPAGTGTPTSHPPKPLSSHHICFPPGCSRVPVEMEELCDGQQGAAAGSWLKTSCRSKAAQPVTAEQTSLPNITASGGASSVLPDIKGQNGEQGSRAISICSGPKAKHWALFLLSDKRLPICGNVAGVVVLCSVFLPFFFYSFSLISPVQMVSLLLA